MRCSNPRGDVEEGSAAIEVLVLGVLLIVPLVYLVLAVAALQGGAFAAEGAARQAARSIVLAPDDATGRAAASAAVEAGLADWHIAPRSAAVTVRCTPDPADCLTPRGSVRVDVRVAVALPLAPRALALDAAGSVAVAATATQQVSMFAVVPG